MIKKMVWAIPVSIGGVAIAATAIGVGYTQSQKANPYVDFYRRPATPGDTALVNAYTSAVRHGAKVVVGAGFTHTNPIKAAANQQFFKENNTGLLLLDDTCGETTGGYQIASVTFRISEAGFLTGIALGEYLNYYQSIFAPNKDDRLTYAAWGGMPFGTILSFMSGFQQGINYFNNKVVPVVNEKKEGTYKPIHQVTSAHSFAGGFAPDNGKQPADELFGGVGTQTWSVYEQGKVESGAQVPEWKNKNDFKIVAVNEVPDAVLVVAGPQVTTAIDSIKVHNAKSVIVGVDVAQEDDKALNQPFKTPLSGDKQSIDKPICFSIMKDLAKATSNVLENITAGKTTSPTENENHYGGLGWNSVGDLGNNGVAVSDAGKTFLYNALIKAGVIQNGKEIADPTKSLSEDEFARIYKESKDAIQAQPDYLYNQGNRDNVKGDESKFIATEDVSAKNPLPGYQIRNQYIAPFTSGGVGTVWKPDAKTEGANYTFEDNIKNTKLVPESEEAAYKKFAAFASKQLQEDRDNAIRGKNFDTFKNDVKIVLSESTSVLLDSSFSQSAFQGILEYYYYEDPAGFSGLYNEFRTSILQLPPVTPTVKSIAVDTEK